MAMVEVDREHYTGTLRYPLFAQRDCGFYRDCPESLGYPAGNRTTIRERGAVVAVCVETTDGPRYWLSDSLTVRTVKEADAWFVDDLHRAAAATLKEKRIREEAAAAARGMTVEQFRNYLADQAMLRRFRRAADEHQRFRDDIDQGRWRGTEETRRNIPSTNSEADHVAA